jgi:hypothetical protein
MLLTRVTLQDGRTALRRRASITLIGDAATWPLAPDAQQAGKMPTIGFLGANASVNAREP